MFWPDGSLHWIAGRGRGDYDDAGRCLRMRGIALDITRRKQAEAERQRTLERIRALHEIGMAINSSLDLQTILDTLLEKIDLFIPYSSASAVRLLNKDSGRLEGLACRNLDAAEPGFRNSNQ